MPATLSSLTRIPQIYRNSTRAWSIFAILAKHGFDDVLSRLGVEDLLAPVRRWFRRSKRTDAVQYNIHERIRMAIEDLGATFIKFGQILATRPDLIPMPLVLELRKLQDKVPPFSLEDARLQIEHELGKSVDELFARFSPTPLAAGSIAQVHEAELKTGEKVVVKVQRPNLERLISTDLDILGHLADAIHENLPEIRQWKLPAIVQEFKRSIMKEIDFTREAYHIRRFTRNFEGDARYHILKVYDEYTTERVLTMEQIFGTKVGKLMEDPDRPGVDRKLIARHGVDLVFRMIFLHGFFHADPHPGNIIIMSDNRIALIDFGMMGTFDDSRIYDILVLLLGVITRDMDTIIKLFSKLELISDEVDVRALRTDGTDLIERYATVSLKSIDLGRFFQSLFEMLARHKVIVPPDLLLMGKSLATIDGIARTLDPDLDPIQSIKPLVFREYIRRLADPKTHMRMSLDTAEDYMTLVRAFPNDMRQILARLRRGQLGVNVDIPEIDLSVRETGRSSNRISLGLIIAALVVGASTLLGSPGGMMIGDFSLAQWIGVVGLGAAGVLAVTLFFAILRSGGIGR